jgi:hypothetical protein
LKNTTHRFGRGRKNVAIVPLLAFVTTNQRVRFMHQCRCPQRLAHFCHLCRRQLQLIVHERQKFLGRLRITLLNLRQNAGNVGHGAAVGEIANDRQSPLR